MQNHQTSSALSARLVTKPSPQLQPQLPTSAPLSHSSPLALLAPVVSAVPAGCPASALEGLQLPAAAWMWKPRSTLYDGDDTPRVSKSIFGLRRFGANDWHRRYVFADGGGICYGKDRDRYPKMIFYGSVRGGGAESKEAMTKQKAPPAVTQFGWYLESGAKRVLFACESGEARQVWVAFVAALLERLAALRAAGPRPSVLPATILRPAASSVSSPPSPPPPPQEQQMRQQVQAQTQATPAAPGATAPTTATGQPSTRRTTGGRAAAPASSPPEAEAVSFVDGSLDWDGRSSVTIASKRTSAPAAVVSAKASSVVPASHLGQSAATSSARSSATTSGLDDDDDSDSDTARSSGGVGGSSGTPMDTVSAASSRSSHHSADGDSSGYLSDNDDVDSGADSEEADSDAAAEEEAFKRVKASLDAQRARLNAIAAQPHSYLASRVKALASHLATDDNTANVVFSLSVEKVARGDKLQPRDLVVTRKHLYLFSRRKMGGGTKSRVVAVGDIVGVMESTTAPHLLAILIPAFHDLLIRFPATAPGDRGSSGSKQQQQQQQSITPKEELVAHLFTVHDTASHGRHFRFESGPDPGSVVRRHEADHHYPLAASPGDRLEVAVRLPLFPLLRMAGDTIVYWSSIVRQVRTGAPPRLRALVITDGAVYLLKDTLSKLGSRSAHCDVISVLYDRGAQSILLQCSRRALLDDGTPQGDLLFSVQLADEFQGVLAALRLAQREGYGRRAQLSSSRQLYAQAHLSRRKKARGAASRRTGEGCEGSLCRLLDDVEPRRKRRGFAHRLKDAWRASVRQETKYLAWLRSGGEHSVADADENADPASLLAPTHAITDASLAMGPGTGLSASLLAGFGGASSSGEDPDETDADGDGVAGTGSKKPTARWAAASVRFQAQYRFVNELVREYDDLLALIPSSEAALDVFVAHEDRLRVGNSNGTGSTNKGEFTSPQVTAGRVLFSAPCSRLAAKVITVLAKMTQADSNYSSGSGAVHEALFRRFSKARAVCVAQEGILVLFAGTNGNHGSDLPKARRQSTTGGAVEDRVETFVPWRQVGALVRCHRGAGTVLGLMTKGTAAIHDVLIDLGEEGTLASFMQAAAIALDAFARASTREPSEIVGPTEDLPLFSAPRPESVAKALRKLVYDPFPTVALRYTTEGMASDRLGLAVVPDVAEPCRRYGDNTLHFSGVAWRFRSETLRKLGGAATVDPGASMNRRNNHLYKSFVLVLTNVAVLLCTKGGYEVVRRTELTKLRAVYVHERDPDTVLLMVPDEYDIYIRIPGRGREFVVRLQEAFLEWTDYALYRPSETVGSHRAHEYALPVCCTSPIAPLGSLTKPNEFNAIQASRSPAESREQTAQWHQRYLQKARERYEAAAGWTAQSGAPHSASLSLSPLVRPPAVGAAASPSWPVVQAWLAEEHAVLRFGHRRAFRFGLRATNAVPAMQEALRLLQRYAEMRTAADAMIAAVRAADADGYEHAAKNAAAYPELAPLIAEQAGRYRATMARHASLTALLAAVGRATAGGAMELQALLAQARAMGFDRTVLWRLRSGWTMRDQREAWEVWLRTDVGRTSLAQGSIARRALLAVAAAELGLEIKLTSTKPVSSVDRHGGFTRRTGLSTSNSSSNGSGDCDDEEECAEAALALAHAIRAASQVGMPALVRACDRARLLLDEPSNITTKPVLTQVSTSARAELQEQFCAAEHALVVLRQTEAARRECGELGRAIAYHRAADDWQDSLVNELAAWADRLLSQVPETEPALAEPRELLTLHQATLGEQRHRLVQRARQRGHEAAAAHRFKAQLQERMEAAGRVGRAIQRRDLVERRRRQADLLAAWEAQASDVKGRVATALAGGTAESLRYAIKQCVVLQRAIAEGLLAQKKAAAAEALASVASATTSAASPTAVMAEAADAKLVTGAGGLVAMLHAAVEEARGALEESNRGAAAHTASTTASAPVPLTSCDGSGCGAGAKDAGTAPSADLPEVLANALAAHDAAAVIAYVEAHEEEMSAAAVAEAATRWAATSARAAWVQRLHLAVGYAHTLRSRELLLPVVAEADARQHTDDVVERARAALASGGDVGVVESSEEIANTDTLRWEDSVGSAAAIVPDAVRVDAWKVHEDDEMENNELGGSNVGGDSDAEPDVGGPSKETWRDDDIALEDTPTPLHGKERGDGSASVSAASVSPSPSPPAVTSTHTVTVSPAATNTLLSLLPHSPSNPRVVRLCSALCELLQTQGGTPQVTAPVGQADNARAATTTTAIAGVVTDGRPARAVLLAWSEVLADGSRPRGFFRKTPRTVRDVLSFLGDCQRGGNYLAPYTNRLVRDLDRDLGLTGKSTADASAEAANVPALPLLALQCAAGVLEGLVAERVIQEATLVGAEARTEVLLESAALAQEDSLRDLLRIAQVCDRLTWPPWRAELRAVLGGGRADGARSGGAAPSGARSLSVAPSTPLPLVPRTPGGASPDPCAVTCQPPPPAKPLSSPSSNTAATTISVTASGTTPPRTHTPSRLSLSRAGNATEEADRAVVAAACAQLLRRAVASLSTYFTDELRRCANTHADGVHADGSAKENGNKSADSSEHHRKLKTDLPPLESLFDERAHPAVASVVESAVLPAVVALLEAGLRRGHHVVRTRTAWDALLAFRTHLQAGSRHLAGVEVVAMVELVQLLTSTEENSRFAGRLSSLPEEELQALRVRFFLRECLNRHQLAHFFDAFFPPPGVDVEWNRLSGTNPKADSAGEGLWKLYDPRRCVLLPRHCDPGTEQLWAVLQRLAAVPFAVVVDRELR